MGHHQVADNGFVPAAKLIVKNLLHRTPGYVTVIYRRVKRDVVRGRMVGADVQKEKQTAYCWQRVSGSKIERAGQWVCVQYERRHLIRIPNALPEWEDDVVTPVGRQINFQRAGLVSVCEQAPLRTVGGLLGTRVSSSMYHCDVPVWGNRNGRMYILNAPYALGLIDARAHANKIQHRLDDVVKYPSVRLKELGFSDKAIGSLTTLRQHRSQKPEAVA